MVAPLVRSFLPWLEHSSIAAPPLCHREQGYERNLKTAISGSPFRQATSPAERADDKRHRTRALQQTASHSITSSRTTLTLAPFKDYEPRGARALRSGRLGIFIRPPKG